jgi:phosphoribosylcarboxyaminoimidazole (NCAIR) mutase
VPEINRIIVSIVALAMLQAVSMPAILAANTHIMLLRNAVRISHLLGGDNHILGVQLPSSVPLSVFF